MVLLILFVHLCYNKFIEKQKCVFTEWSKMLCHRSENRLMYV